MHILAIGAHHDDIELGCGGSLARFARGGDAVSGIVLTDSATEYPRHGIRRTADEARAEARAAAREIGYTLIETAAAPARNGELAYTVPLMREVEAFIDARQVGMVFCHWPHDVNTDHAAASRIALTAARRVPRVLLYRSNRYAAGVPFNPAHFIDISATIEFKRRALACFTVEVRNRGAAWAEAFVQECALHGAAIGCAQAEAFEAVRFLV